MKSLNTSVKIGAIIQARTGAKRFPNKIIRPFHDGDTILDLVILNTKKSIIESIVLATSTNPNDSILKSYADKHQIKFFAGPEEDVLERFILAAKEYNFDIIIRICADNPFLLIDGIDELVNYFIKMQDKKPEYISFIFANNLPAIKTHFGLYAELVTVDALVKVKNRTNSSLYHEHVTNYIYEFKHEFRLQFINAPREIFNRFDIRLTIDNEADFKVAKEIYENINWDLCTRNICNFLDNRSDLIKEMRKQISLNKK